MAPKPQITGVHAASWRELLGNWWQLVLAALILASIVSGVIYIIFIAFHSLRNRFKNYQKTARKVSSTTKSHLAQLSTKLASFADRKADEKPGSFGVYLGAFESPPTEAQTQLLSAWDLLIVDPCQSGIIGALCSGSHTAPKQCLARLDLDTVIGDSTRQPILIASDWADTLLITSSIASSQQCVFSGIVISGWEKHLSGLLLEELIRFLGNIGLSVYIEVEAPNFLSDPKLAELDELTGMVIRNGAVSENGEERDAFQMSEMMRPTIKAFVSQACLRSFVVLLWETLDDDATPSNAVIKRCYTWSRFYSALPWIGSKNALSSAELSMSQKEPFGAFDWLKELKVMDFHTKWRSNVTIHPQYVLEASQSLKNLYSILDIYFPDPGTPSHGDYDPTITPYERPNSPTESLTLSCMSSETATSGYVSANPSLQVLDRADPIWLQAALVNIPGHVMSTSPTGSSYDYLGCFPLGSTVTRKVFGEVSRSQQQLKNMRLLDEIKPTQLNEIGKQMQKYCEALGNQGMSGSEWLAAIQELAHNLCSASAESDSLIRAHISLDAGLQVQPGTRFWAVYSIDEDYALDIYISRNVQDITGVILHTFLSSRGCPRHECFEAEASFSEWAGTLVKHTGLPQRLLRDLVDSSPVELLQLIQSLSVSHSMGDPSLVNKLRDACKRQLLDSVDFKQLKDISTIGFLNGTKSAQDLISSRINWYRQSGCQHPDETLALQNFLSTYSLITEILRGRRIPELQRITENLASIIEKGKVDSRVDLVALSVFCAMRKHAFDEAYMEVTDRNTLFNDQSDQAAAFAELFATGARCEAYFDMTPSAFGKILSDRYRAYHHKIGHEPPIWTDANPATPSAYAAAKIDVDPTAEKSSMNAHQRFTFLSVFAIPALIDILLLTTTGKGLYLSSSFTEMEIHSATLALMVSLLISGTVGTWITCGGNYYLISMAFSAMNMFVVTRLIGGLAFTLVAATIGFAIVAGVSGPGAGAVFFLYLIALSAYLCLLAALANFSYPGSAFQSGRPVIMSVVPFLFVSPIICIWVQGYDIYVYTSVLYVFITLLLLGARHTGSKWTTWYLDIEKIGDQELREWYIETHQDGDEKSLAHLTDPGVLKIARAAILEEVLLEKRRFRKTSGDPLVQKLAKSYDATIFLMEWYSTYSGTPLPIPFSSTWNMQTKVALQTLKQLQTGMRLHNAFIHWRQAGDEVGCSLLYFIVALLDKWNTLLAGGALVGYSTWDRKYSAGFALAYYLIGAVLLDFNATKLHKMTARGTNMLIGDTSTISEAVSREVKARKYLYWTMLGRYLLFHVWSLAVASVLLWVFDSTANSSSTIMFLAYIGAYTGLLWFQYTKIFSGPRSLKPLLVAVAIGIPLGQLLRFYVPQYEYGDVTALGASTWTAAFLCLYYARIRAKPVGGSVDSQNSEPGYKKLGSDGAYHSFTNDGKDPLLSQGELKVLYENLQALRDEERYEINTLTHPGLEVRAVLTSAIRYYSDPQSSLSRFALEAYPEALEILDQAVSAFDAGSIVVICIPMAAMSYPDVKAVSYTSSGHIRIIMGCEMMDVSQQQSSISMFCQTTAETLLHAVAEIFMGMSHDDAILVESLLALATSKISPIAQRVKSQLRFLNPASKDARKAAQFFEERALQYLALDFRPDLDWERLPRDIRDFLLARCAGQREELSRSQQDWLLSAKTQGTPVEKFLGKCNFGAYVSASNRTYALGSRLESSPRNTYNEDTLDPLMFLKSKPLSPRFTFQVFMRGLKYPFSVIYHNVGICLRLIAIAFVAEPELQRELDYALHTTPKVVRSTVLFFVSGIWRYTKLIEYLVMSFFLLHGRKNVSTLWKHIGGTTVSLLKNQRLSIESTEGSSTAFIHSPYGSAGTFKVSQYSGNHDKEPTDKSKLQRISTYSKSMLLQHREEYKNGTKGNVYKYEYATDSEKQTGRRIIKSGRNSRYPLLRKCLEGPNEFEEHNFNSRGLVTSGSYFLHGSLVRFTCHYRQGNSNSGDDLLRAEFVWPHLTCTVNWSVPPRNHQEKQDKWVPSSQVMEATFVLGSDVYESAWKYDHKHHPTVHTTLNGEVVETPPIIQWDHLGVLKKPSNFTFLEDDLLINFKTLQSHAIVRWMGFNTHHNSVSTSKARSRLWKAWKSTPGFDGVMVRWLDEMLLRKEPLLRPYWRRRDRGDLLGAEAYLNESVDSIMSAVDLDNTISGWTPLAFKLADFYAFGQGGSANSRTISKDPDFDNDKLQVLAVDSGTWPNEGGGVSACRRDMINNLGSVSWYMIAESANDSGLPKHQTEMNVRSLKVIPLWGLDFMTPTHGLFRDKLDTEVEHVPRYSTKLDVERNFIPILKALVKGARTMDFTQAEIMQTTRALVNLNAYFSDSKHWGAVWTSRFVKDAWRNLWLSQDLVSPTPSEGWFQTEIPTIAQLDGALELWFRYLFIFSIPIPERVPAIFQASHHSVSAAYGIVCKIKRGCTLQIWDHAISWRETNLYLSSDLCTMAPFVRNSLLGLMKITSQLILHHADTILPCADFFNPGWEIEIGSNQGNLEHRNTFKRKIDPVVNGIPDMTKFAPIKTITSTLPTVTMLSHVWYAKDIKTAILAADIIVNEWGFKDYRLDIYGAIDKAPSYSTDCFEIIASKSLPRFVVMRGEANPATVLGKTWVFLNSSISEGLPLALGEAALTGAPVVCTDVGASLRVLTDPDTGACYSAVVAPNDARNLARAQVNFLAMLDEWAPYANDAEGFTAPSLSDKPTPGDIEAITKRMYEKVEERKELGMRSREIVQKSFGGERYLREHEQMLWIGKARYDLLHPRQSTIPKSPHIQVTADPIASTVWGAASLPSARPPLSSVQTSSMMTTKFQPSTLNTPGIRSLFDSGVSARYGSKASTLFVPSSAAQGTPVKKPMPPRVKFLSRGPRDRKGYESSVITVKGAKELPGEDSFLHDITIALEKV